jgi:FAD/FMN-containing dehydrogenase
VSGPFQASPSLYLVPRDLDDLIVLVEWAAKEGIPLIPRGAGTGMPGGNLGPSLVVSLLEGLDWVAPRLEGTRIRAGAGAVAGKVDAVARTHGRRLPFLPASASWCTLGGIVANNSAGASSFRHGSTHRWVTGLAGIDAWGRPFRAGFGGASQGPLPQAVKSLPQLSALNRFSRDEDGIPSGWPRVRKNSSGYALDRFLADPGLLSLLPGSEGTLAIITEVEFETAPVPPQRGVLLLPARSPGEVVQLARAMDQEGATACEFLGRRFLEVAGLDRSPDFGAMARGAFALLLVEVEGEADQVHETLDRCQAVGRQVAGPGRRATNPEEVRELWRLRKAASPIIAREAGQGRISTQFIEDSVVPVSRLGDYLSGLDRILDAASLDAVIFGHAGDGNVHVNPLVEIHRPGWEEQVRTVLDQVVDLVASLGGTLAGEHGDGRLRAPFMERIWGAELAQAFQSVKETLDPAGILNPGVVVPLPGQDPLEGLSPRARTHP